MPAAAQTDGREVKKVKLSWDEVYAFLDSMMASAPKRRRVTGPKRSGALLALLCAYRYNLQYDPSGVPAEDTIWIDDIADSGATVNDAMRSILPGTNLVKCVFMCLLAKVKASVCVNHVGRFVMQSESDVWWVFPWERGDAPTKKDSECIAGVQPNSQSER